MHTYAQASEYLTENRSEAELDAFNEALGRVPFQQGLSIREKLTTLRRSIAARRPQEASVPDAASNIMREAGIAEAVPAARPTSAPAAAPAAMVAPTAAAANAPAEPPANPYLGRPRWNPFGRRSNNATVAQATLPEEGTMHIRENPLVGFLVGGAFVLLVAIFVWPGAGGDPFWNWNTDDDSVPASTTTTNGGDNNVNVVVDAANDCPDSIEAQCRTILTEVSKGRKTPSEAKAEIAALIDGTSRSTGNQASNSGSKTNQNAAATSANPGIKVNANPNTSAVYNGTCKVTQDGPNGIYFQSGQGESCSIELSDIPDGWQMVVDAISFTYNDVRYDNLLQGFRVRNGRVNVQNLMDGAVKIAPSQEAGLRWCTQAKWLHDNGAATWNQSRLPGWEPCANGFTAPTHDQ